jgi:hypothetical protein
MAQQRKKLDGWWKNIPFIVLPMALFMSFAYLETARLHNQYEQSDVIGYIQQLNKDIEHLRATERELTRIEEMKGRSSDLDLHPPNPNQVISLSSIVIESAYAKVRTFQSHYSVEKRPTRTVMINVDYEDIRPQPDLSGPFSGGVAYGQEESD